MNAGAIHIENLFKEYPQGGGVHGLNLRIEKGAAFGLLGPNGAGKSTTLKMIMGLFQPSSGKISILGHDVLATPETVRRLVGYVPEHQHMYPWMTVSALVRFVSAFYPTWDTTLCRDLLRDYGLSETKRIRELSNGMQTKLALVLALSHNPELLVLDEPTTGLDPLVREEFLLKIRDLVKARRCTVLFSSHIMSDIEKVADTIGIMNAGHLVVTARREDLLATTRQVCVTLEPNHGQRTVPRGTLFEEFVGGTWVLTVRGFTDDTLHELHAKNRVRDVSVSAPDLEETMKAFVKGARSR